MGRKAGKYKKKESSGLTKNKSGRFVADDEDMMNDEIDAFHKNRDVVPLNINEDTEESDEDNEHPVFDFEDDKDDDEEDDDEDADVDDDDKPPKGLAAKIVRTQKYLRSKFPGIDDEMLDEAEEEEEERDVWGKKKDMYYEVKQITIDDEDEDEADEEAEVLRLQREKAKVLSMKDFGIEDASEDEFDMEPTFEEILSHGKSTSKDSIDKGVKDDDGMSYEIVKKDLNALTKEEQMDVVYSSAPELVGLLSELKDALKQLENKVNPLANKILGSESAKKGGMHYFVVKQLLLQSFCQAIAFYLLLKSEGQQVRDHPVVSRLVEIKNLLDKMKELDENLPVDLENFVNKDVSNRTDVKLVEEIATARSDSLNGSQMLSSMSSEKQAIVKSDDTTELNNLRSLKNSEPMHKNQDKQEVGVQSREMLKVRAALEEKLRQKGVFSSIAPKNITAREHLQPVNRQLETLDDFDDEAMEIDGVANGRSNGDVSGKNSQQLTLRSNKRKVISGDDDVPRRDDIGERRRKHELRVLAGAGIQSFEDVEDETAKLSSDEGTDVNSESDNDSDLEYYKQVEQQLAAKLAAKSDKYSRTPEVSSLPDVVVDGKRNITRQIEKNRGLTRARKKLTKNPRKKYKLKHKKAEVRRKGQVREIRKPAGPYGGEASGINAGISRSIRFKS